MSGYDGSGVAVPRRPWLRIGARRVSRVTAVAPVDDTTVDLAELAYDRMLTNAERALEVAENRLIRAQGSLENVMRHLGERHRWAGKTQPEILAAIVDELLEVHLIVTTGKAK